jgi:hypothetical protein
VKAAPRARTRAGIAGATTLAAVIAVAGAREASIGPAEMTAADAAAARADWPSAVAHARAAAEAVLPGAPWTDRALRKLQSIGADAEIRDDRDTAMLAYGAMRTAAVTGLPWPRRDAWRDMADASLARLAGSRTR